MKSFTGKLFTSPTGSGFLESPGFFFGLGAGLVIFALHGAVTGQFAIGPFVIAHAVKPGLATADEVRELAPDHLGGFQRSEAALLNEAMGYIYYYDNLRGH